MGARVRTAYFAKGQLRSHIMYVSCIRRNTGIYKASILDLRVYGVTESAHLRKVMPGVLIVWDSDSTYLRRGQLVEKWPTLVCLFIVEWTIYREFRYQLSGKWPFAIL